jgi:uncharacterized protein YoxC
MDIILAINNLNEMINKNIEMQNNTINNLIIKIENLENKLSELNSSVENNHKIINERTDKMNYHIDFTVQVYNTVKKPMDFFTNIINKYMGINSIKLPELNYIPLIDQ